LKTFVIASEAWRPRTPLWGGGFKPIPASTGRRHGDPSASGGPGGLKPWQEHGNESVSFRPSFPSRLGVSFRGVSNDASEFSYSESLSLSTRASAQLEVPSHTVQTGRQGQPRFWHEGVGWPQASAGARQLDSELPHRTHRHWQSGLLGVAAPPSNGGGGGRLPVGRPRRCGTRRRRGTRN
jgi:hypothetical protein